jgi:hypothetical protein
MSQQVHRVQWHTDKFKVVREPAGEGRIFSKLVSLQAFHRGEIVAKLDNIQYVTEKKWTTIQVGKNLHIVLNDELVFMNHSCNPSVNVDVSEMVIKANRDISPGDEITYFYPSTEWEMSTPFVCHCDQPQCLRIVAGANHIPISKLSHYFINKHICDLIIERLSSQSS